jgi:predicted CxxxxCH...CXXCH cytochrome family protein
MSTAIPGLACHTTSPASNPTGCLSCHHTPPDGTVSPNTANAHIVHRDFFTTATASCRVCHFNLGMDAATQIGQPSHANKVVNLALTGNYLAKSGGAFIFNATTKTCSNVTCHGGQTTPPWNTVGQINVDIDCIKCHVLGTTQYNSYNSGEHNLHVNGRNIACTSCHNTTKLAVNHFRNLSTHVMEGPASGTIAPTGFIPANNWNPTTRSCTPVCHGTETW